MKIGVAYNFFDGEELLESSIKSIRNNVDYITVIYQQISNFGLNSKINIKDFLQDLVNKKLIDDFIEYKPRVGAGGHFNEIVKRNLGLYVPFIYKIRPGVEFILGHPFPVLIDPTRRMEPGNCKIFTREGIEMHHMSFVRKDLSIKLNNSSAKMSFENVIGKIVNYYENWEYPNPAMWASANLIDVVETENLFDVNI